MEKEKKSEIHITNNFNAPIGQHIDHVDTINFRMDGDGTFHFGMVENVKEEKRSDEAEEAEETKTSPADDALVEQLKPLFFNNEKDVRLFLNMISGMAQEGITDVVNQWVKEKRISDHGNSRKGVLWDILHKAGLYKRTKANWNGRVK